MIAILISLIIGVLLGYIGGGDYRALVWIIFALITVLIITNLKGKLDVSSFLAILFGGIGLLLTQHFSPDAYTLIVSNVDKYTGIVIEFFVNAVNK